MRVKLHAHEDDRLASLTSYGILDSAPEQDFDALTRLAATICATPIAMITLVDENRQWFLGRFGLELTETPRTESVCSDVVASGIPLVVGDLTGVARYAELDAVAGPEGVRAYAGVPITGRDGLPLGTLCVVDTTKRMFSTEQLSALADLARQVVITLELRRADVLNGLDAVVSDARQPNRLRQALKDHEFVPYFQPTVDMRDGSILGLEALIRWQHPTLGLLTPEDFLPGLEIGALADWTGRAMLAATCAVMVDLCASGTELRDGVAVNVSGSQLTAPGLAQTFLATLARHDLPGRALTVEVTETTEIPDLAIARTELRTLRNADVRVVADDFGVGWSNLMRLLELPLSGLKIDKHLVTTMVGDRVREDMVAATIAMSARMGLDVVAEGVETAEVRDLLLHMGCHRGQGWLFSRAVSAAELPRLLDAH